MRKRRFIGVIAALIMIPGVASAEYLEPAEDGYLPPRSERGVEVMSYAGAPPESPMRFGIGFDFGVAAGNVGDVDDRYFLPNEADPLGSFPAGVYGLELWLELQRAFRVGLDISGVNGGDGGAQASTLRGGLLLEGGYAFPSGWGIWGGAVLGSQRVSLESRDDDTGIYEFDTRGLYGRLHARFERMLAPFVALRVTFFGESMIPFSEDYFADLPADAPPPTFPDDDSGFQWSAFGGMIGVVLTTF